MIDQDTMTKKKRKLTAAEKAAKKRRRKEYMIIFINGKQKRVKRPPTIDGMDMDEFIRQNADPIWLHQNEMWDYMDEGENIEKGQKNYDNTLVDESDGEDEWNRSNIAVDEDDIDLPF